MADEIYSSSYWGNGVCDNTIDWGVVYKDYAGCTPSFTNTYSLAFDGVDDFVSTGYNYNALVTPNLSISFWFKSTSTSLFKFPICIQSADGGYTTSIVMVYGDNLLIADRTGWVFGTNQDINDGNWHNVIVTAAYSGSTTAGTLLNMYLDGNLTPDLTSATMGTGTASYLSGDLYMGSFNGVSNWYACSVDEVAVWESILTSENITSIYNSGTPTDLSAISGLTAWYRMGDYGTWKSPQWLIPNNENKTKFSNYSFEYDGVDDFIDTGITTTGTNDVSISCWIKTSETFAFSESRCAFGGYNNVSGSSYTLGRLGSGFATPNDMQVRVYNTLGTTKLNDGNWHNIIYTHNYTTKETKAYVDGNTTPEAISTFAAFSANFRIAIGWNGATSSFYFEGNVDECAYFTSILGASDVTAIYNSGVPTDISSLSPVGYWRSEQSNFTDNWLVDNSALSNYSTRSFNFDGIDDYIDVGVISTFQSTANFSVSCWLKVPNLSASNFFIGTYTSGSNTIYSYIATNGEVVFNLNNTYQRLSGTGTPLLIDNWYNIVLVYDGTLGTSDSMLIYINGILRSGGVTAGIPATTGTNTGVTYLGGLGGFTSRFTGDLDEVSFFNTSLTPSEITSIYNSGTPTTITGATSHWRMGEDATFNTNWNVPDNAGSATGTSANMTIADLEGNAPNYTGGGLSNNMTIEDRVGDAPNSTSNALSYNMDEVDRETDVPT